jgi:hypothetical protein
MVYSRAMRRATITLTDALEAAVEAHLSRLTTPPSLNVLLQVALRHYLGAAGAARPGRDLATSFVAEPPAAYDASRLAGEISLDPESALALRQAAAREGLSPAELVSVVLREYLRGPDRPPPRGVGAYRSGRSDVSTRAEALLRKAARRQRQ